MMLSKCDRPIKESLNIVSLLINLMKKLHWTVFGIIIACIAAIVFLGYISMTTATEIPSNIVLVLASIASSLIGYGVGKSE